MATGTRLAPMRMGGSGRRRVGRGLHTGRASTAAGWRGGAEAREVVVVVVGVRVPPAAPRRRGVVQRLRRGLSPTRTTGAFAPVCAAREGRLQSAQRGDQFEIQARSEDFVRRDSANEVPEGVEPSAANIPDV